MTQIKLLKAQFTDLIAPWELPAFRGAIIQKVGRECDWFHNHLHENRYLYRYPKIQYKCWQGHPMLFCLHEGIEAVHQFFEQTDWSLNLSERQLTMRLRHLDMLEFELGMLPKPQTYQLRNWIALNQKNYPAYQQLTALGDKVTFLEQKLAAHIISFAKGVGWHIPERVHVKLCDLPTPRWVKFKDQKVLGFNVRFTANVTLPDALGLGAKVSIGYGVVTRVKKKEKLRVKPTQTNEHILS